MLPVAFRLSSAPRTYRIVSTALNLRNDETPGLARPIVPFENLEMSERCCGAYQVGIGLITKLITQQTARGVGAPQSDVLGGACPSAKGIRLQLEDSFKNPHRVIFLNWYPLGV